MIDLGPESMSGERFVRVCPTHVLELCDDWCPAGHVLTAVAEGGAIDTFWCWDMKLGRRYAIVTGDRIHIEEWDGLDVMPKLSERDDTGMAGYLHNSAQTEKCRRYYARLKAAREDAA